MRLGSLLCALLVLAPASRTQPRTPYRDLIERFRSGSNDAIEQLLQLSDADLDRGAADAASQQSGWPLLSIDAAMLLHTEAAIDLATRADGRAAHHIRLATDLANAAVRDHENSWFVFRWASILDLESRQHLKVPAFAATEHLRSAPWYRDAKRVRDAAFFELTAATDLSGASRARDRAFLDVASLRTAEVAFENALRDSGILLAAVHLGRIAMLRGRDRQAREYFGSAMESHFPVTRYYAQLLLGSLEEREERFAEAEHLYRTALAGVPHSQSSGLALAALLERRGRSEDARTALAGVMADSADRRTFDPWWTYLPPQPDDVGWLFVELRAEIRP
jgi:tetratricopeptide (TPR) repeat protein